LKLEIQNPGEHYRGSRFDWCAAIVQVILNDKHSFCTNETANPLLSDSEGRGFYNEFGIGFAIGYDECLPGKRFHKIGVGLLQKPDNEPYAFTRIYDIHPMQIDYKFQNNLHIYIIDSPVANGFAYYLKKTVMIDGASFSIRYELKNTGTKAFRTSEYVHNFVSLNFRKIDPLYKLKFQFSIDAAGFVEAINPEQRVGFEGSLVYWNSRVEDPFFFSRMNKMDLINCSWELIHEEEKIGIRESCNGRINMVNLWGTKHVISPEMFHPINLLPGKSDFWERKFEFYEI
jgi:hypothetical protein